MLASDGLERHLQVPSPPFSMNLSFWRDKRVLLTGHTGFKGGWLALWLERLGARVTGFSLAPPTDPSLFEEARVAEGMHSVLGDIRALPALEGAFAEAEPEIVLHLAAQSLVHYGYRNPLETWSTNVMGTAHVLEMSRRSPGVRAVVSVTSDKCYRNNEWVWGYRESDPLGGKDPYSSSKACAELVTAAFRDSYFTGDEASPFVASARSGNVIGGGDWSEDRLVPDLVRGFTGGRATAIRCPGATRPWQHVLEPLRGYLLLAQRLWEEGPDFASAWNFGPAERDARSVQWIADRLVERWGGDARWELDAETHSPEATYLALDCSKAHRQLGWRPALPLERGVDWLVDWYRDQHAGGDARELTLRQIAEYEEMTSTP